VIKAELLQSSESHDPSEIILIWGFAAQETFMIISNGEKSLNLKTDQFFRILWCNRKYFV